MNFTAFPKLFLNDSIFLNKPLDSKAYQIKEPTYRYTDIYFLLCKYCYSILYYIHAPKISYWYVHLSY